MTETGHDSDPDDTGRSGPSRGDEAAAEPASVPGGEPRDGPDWHVHPDEWKVRSGRGADWIAQLQAMIDGIAVEAGPALREVAAKAAELAAVAAERAGPLAQRAAIVTTEVGQKVAARSKEMAADLRRGATHTADGAGSTDDRPGGNVPGA